MRSAMSIEFENPIFHQNSPVKIFRRDSNSNSEGCFFHWHEELEFYYVKTGGVNLLCNGSSSWLYPNDIGFVNWCEPHKSLGFLDNTSHYIIQIDLSSTVFREVDAKSYRVPSFIKNCPAIVPHFEKLIDAYLSHDTYAQYFIIGELYNILGNILALSQEKHSTDHKSTTYVKEILKYIHESFQTNIKLNHIADHVGISVAHMCRLFKTHTGSTIVSYINKLKFNMAVSLLSKGYSVTDVSAMVGFNDYNYFSRCFKNVMDVSPSYYKQSKISGTSE